MIIESYRKENLFGSYFYTVDARRYLYRTDNWHLGRLSVYAKIMSLPETPPDPCEPPFCLSYSYSSYQKENVIISRLYCGLKSKQLRVICEKRLPFCEINADGRVSAQNFRQS